MTNFLLLHGEWLGAWIWDAVIEQLAASRDTLDIGQIIAVDLPGHGHRQAPDIRRITTDYYVEAAVTEAQVKHLDRITLVVHSLAATLTPQIADRLGGDLERIVFLGGMLPSPGAQPIKTLPSITRRLVTAFKPAEKGIQMPTMIMKRALCNGMDRIQAKTLIERLVPDPYLPWLTPMPSLNFSSRVSLTYAVLTRDKSLPPRVQRSYARALPSAQTVDLDAGHAAPITHPGEIARLLLQGVPDKPPEPEDLPPQEEPSLETTATTEAKDD